MFLLISGLSAAASVDLQAKYPFSSVLLDQGGQYYALYWNFTRTTESIYFAVNVSTTGWVGFGLSPNGQMPGSDVVIGWVSNGQGFLWVRVLGDVYELYNTVYVLYNNLGQICRRQSPPCHRCCESGLVPDKQ